MENEEEYSLGALGEQIEKYLCKKRVEEKIINGVLNIIEQHRQKLELWFKPLMSA